MLAATESGSCPPLAKAPAPTGLLNNGVEFTAIPISSTLADPAARQMENTTTSIVANETLPLLREIPRTRALLGPSGS